MIVFNYLVCPIGSIVILAMDLKNSHIFFAPFMIFYTIVCGCNLIVFLFSFLGPLVGTIKQVRENKSKKSKDPVPKNCEKCDLEK